jgi:hypothetical protein
MNTIYKPVVTTADAMVLPWEQREAYHALVHDLTETHKPQGGTERFLVEELGLDHRIGHFWPPKTIAVLVHEG